MMPGPLVWYRVVSFNLLDPASGGSCNFRYGGQSCPSADDSSVVSGVHMVSRAKDPIGMPSFLSAELSHS